MVDVQAWGHQHGLGWQHVHLIKAFTDVKAQTLVVGLSQAPFIGGQRLTHDLSAML